MQVRLKTKGLPPILCNAGSGAVHHHYFGCPVCGNEVGGFVITGTGSEDWCTHQDSYCSECGQNISWQNTNWAAIYKV
jgi:hypothetical protein